MLFEWVCLYIPVTNCGMKRKRLNSKNSPGDNRARPQGPASAQANRKSPAAAKLNPWIIGTVIIVGVLGFWLVNLPLNHRSRDVQDVTPASPAPSAVKTAVTTSNPPSSTEAAPAPVAAKEDADAVSVKQVERANQLLAEGKPEDAVAVLKEAERLNPNDEDIHYNLGIALAKLEKYPEAVQEYQEALRLFPDYAEVHNNLGNLLLRMGKSDEALKQFEEAVKIMPDYASAWNNFGNVLQQRGQTNLAKEYFQKAVGLDTNYWQAHFNLGTSLLREKRMEEARDEFNTVLRLQPDFPPAKAALERISQGPKPSPPQP